MQKLKNSTLTRQEETFFNKLTDKRRASIRLYEEDGIIEVITNLIVDIYKESAHFIYELLQNADDAQASRAEFILKPSGLYFIHNGEKRFSISDPSIPRKDQRQIGHINAITTFAHSTKNEETGNKIGKFGIGFKSVFQYTLRPEVYDKHFRFAIEDHMIPIWLEEDHPLRDDNETLFYLPFQNVREMTPTKAFVEIKEKLLTFATDEGSSPLLFLHKLQSVTWEIQENEQVKNKGRSYLRKKPLPDSSLEAQEAAQERDIHLYLAEADKQSLWVMERHDSLYGQKYCIAFLAPSTDNNATDNELSRYAYCFFPTKEETRMGVLLHAPFELTPNREGIKANREANTHYLKLLGELLADSLHVCKALGVLNDDFFRILPINPSYFHKSIFEPIHNAVKQELLVATLLPTKDPKVFVDKQHAFKVRDTNIRADKINLVHLLNSDVLYRLKGVESAQLVFPSITNNKDSELWRIIIDNYCTSHIEQEEVARKLPDLLQYCKLEWIAQIYGYFKSIESCKRILKKIPSIILKGSSDPGTYSIGQPYDQEGKLQIHLPTDDDSSLYQEVHPFLYQHEGARGFLEDIGLRQPDIEAEIRTVIFKKYESPPPIEVNDPSYKADMEKILAYFSGEDSDRSWLAKKTKNLYIAISCNAEGQPVFAQPKILYFPSQLLDKWFWLAKTTHINYLNINFYNDFSINEETFSNFWDGCGVARLPRLVIDDTELEYEKREKLWQQTNSNIKTVSNEQYYNPTLKGLPEILSQTLNIQNSTVLLWLLHQCEQFYGDQLIEASYKFSWHKRLYHKSYSSYFMELIQGHAWLYNQEGIAKKPTELYIHELHESYPKEIVAKLQERNWIGFKQDHKSKSPTEQIQDILAQLEGQGMSLLEIQQKLASMLLDSKSDADNSGQGENGLNSGQQTKFPQRPIAQKAIDDVLDKASQRPNSLSENPLSETEESKISNTNDSDGTDADPYTPIPIDIGARLEEERRKLELEITRLTRKEELKQVASGPSKRYTFEWFKALLELEYGAVQEDTASKATFSFNFYKAELDPQDDRVIWLYSQSYLPPQIEELGNFDIKLFEESSIKSFLIEVVSPQKKVLKARVKNASELQDVNFSKVQRATIQIQNPDFLLNELLQSFIALDVADDFHMQQELPVNLRFIFGPPGTGKTTYLAKDEILTKMREEPDAKILVLTPTNKAADVLAGRIMEKDGAFARQWLYRYGSVNTSDLETSTVFYPYELPKQALNRGVLITTMARYPYQKLAIENIEGKRPMKDMKWDYIIFDEASMIGLAQMVYTLYYADSQKYTKEFIIAGDPFQIQPIVRMASWKDENIYTLVGLDQEASFVAPKTQPHSYQIQKLDVQYRSLPAIGELFSKYRYGGKLKHDRMNDAPEKVARKVEIPSIDFKVLTFIPFRVSSYESIYRPKKINGSNYQIYMSLFTAKLLAYIDDHIKVLDSPEIPYRIGVICPYRIQVEVISQLWEKHIQARNPQNIEVSMGTVHSFQGDQCEMVIALYNPPQHISSSCFLNKKSIINVSISRAQDKLVILHPYDSHNSVAIDNLHEIKRLQDISSQTPIIQQDTAYIKAEEIERLLLQEVAFENITYPTGHQSVNIYQAIQEGYHYEIRYDERSIDIQTINN